MTARRARVRAFMHAHAWCVWWMWGWGEEAESRFQPLHLDRFEVFWDVSHRIFVSDFLSTFELSV